MEDYFQEKEFSNKNGASQTITPTDIWIQNLIMWSGKEIFLFL